ncbi:MAG TPA: long-chain fatty acid--CoA ligase, partial [Pseudomonas pachastrellae]|nr:long-chain fatty acid--CoA ligase [Halopseudomonas pachastrellae]
MSTPEHYAVSAQLAELGHTTIFDILEQSCSRYGDSPAFSCGADTLTFNQLRGRADAFARYLRQHAGLQPGDRLAIQLPNLLQYTIAILGALRAGLVIVNTNPQ